MFTALYNSTAWQCPSQNCL